MSFPCHFYPFLHLSLILVPHYHILLEYLSGPSSSFSLDNRHTGWTKGCSVIVAFCTTLHILPMINWHHRTWTSCPPSHLLRSAWNVEALCGAMPLIPGSLATATNHWTRVLIGHGLNHWFTMMKLSHCHSIEVWVDCSCCYHRDKRLVFTVIQLYGLVTIAANANLLIICQLGQGLLELGALIADCCATFSAMVLPVHHGKLSLTNVAWVDFWVNPYGSLGLF